MTRDEWYYLKGNQRVGPHAFAYLQKLAAAGELLPTDLICRPGGTEWVSATSFPGLFGPEILHAPPGSTSAIKPRTSNSTDRNPKPSALEQVGKVIACCITGAIFWFFLNRMTGEYIENERARNHALTEIRSLLDDKQWDEAITLLNPFVESSPNRTDGYLYRARAFHAKGELDKARADYETVLSLTDGSTKNQKNIHRRFAFSERGRLYAESGEFDRAIADYTAAIEWHKSYDDQDPDRGYLYLERAKMYNGKKRREEARTDCLTAMKVHKLIETKQGPPVLSDIYVGIGVDAFCLKKYDRAISELTKAIEIHPVNARAYFLRGAVYFAKNDIMRSTLDYDEANRLDPKLLKP